MSFRLWEHSNGVFYAVWECSTGTKRKSLKTKDRIKAQELIESFSLPSEQPEKITLRKFVTEFLDFVEVSRSHATFVIYRTSLKHAAECWGPGLDIKELNSKLLDNLIVFLIRSGLSVPSVNKYMRHLKTAFRYALTWQYIEKPLVFPRPLGEMKENRYLSHDDLKKLFFKIEDSEFYDFCLLSACTGLRSGELIRLLKSDIDNPPGFIRVSAEQKNKTESPIPISKQAREIIDRSIGRYPNKDKLFRFNTVCWISQKFKKVSREAGLDDIRFHDLRHTFASHHAMSGTDIQVIQKLMRHKSLTSTMVYAKLSPDYLKIQCDRIDYDL